MTVIQAPAHPNNYGGYGGAANRPKALVYHTPEELPDDIESTPAWFQNPNASASTQVYADNDGDLYEMVPDEVPAWACGTHTDRWVNGRFEPSNRHWRGVKDALPPWGEAGVSNNCLTLNIEIEGRAHDLNMPEAQYQTVLAWAWEKTQKYNIPIDRDHHVGHSELSTDRRDPGFNFPWDRLINDLRTLAGQPQYEFPIPSMTLEFSDQTPAGDHIHQWIVRIHTVKDGPLIEFNRREQLDENGNIVFDVMVEDWKQV